MRPPALPRPATDADPDRPDARSAGRPAEFPPRTTPHDDGRRRADRTTPRAAWPASR